MKYLVRVGATTFEVEVEGSRVLVGGEAFEAHFAAVPGTPLHHLLLDGASWTFAPEPGAAGERQDGGGGPWVVNAAGERFQVEVVDERTQPVPPLAARGSRPDTGGVVAAPMPGLVVRVEVTEGQRVDAGAGLVVVEAMKMENELRAPGPGVVTRIHVAAGQAVEKGAPLVTLGSADGST
jgi:biotin carboxyl carrier protein